MGIKLEFDANHNPLVPDLVLMKKCGDKIGFINADNLVLKDGESPEISFDVYKKKNTDSIFDKLTDFKLICVPQFDNRLFEIQVTTKDSVNSGIVKSITATDLANAELSQIILRDIHINSEDDIKRKSYKPAVLFDKNLEKNSNATDREGSILHRILEKAPHYEILPFDNVLAKKQRVFEFDSESIYDALQKIEEELECKFECVAKLDDDGKFFRTITAYPLDIVGKNTDGTNEFESEWGKDTNIYVDKENLTDDITLSSDTGSVKNCFKLTCGDDVMTAAVRSLNGNSGYLWEFSESMQNDMSQDLQRVLSVAKDTIAHFTQEQEYNIENSTVYKRNHLLNILILNDISYNNVFYHNQNVKEYNDNGLLDSEQYENYTIKNEHNMKFSEVVKTYYNLTDFIGFLEHTLMPSTTIQSTTAQSQAEKLQSKLNYSSTSTQNTLPKFICATEIKNLDNLSVSSAQSVLKNISKAIVDRRYETEFNVDDNASFSNLTVDGVKYKTLAVSFTVKLKGYDFDSDEFKNMTTSEQNELKYDYPDRICVVFGNDYETSVKQQIDTILADNNTDDAYEITSLFDFDFNPEYTDEQKNHFADDEKTTNSDRTIKYDTNLHWFREQLKMHSKANLDRFYSVVNSVCMMLEKLGISQDSNGENDETGQHYNHDLQNLYNKYLKRLESIMAAQSNIEANINVTNKVLSKVRRIIDGVNSICDLAKIIQTIGKGDDKKFYFYAENRFLSDRLLMRDDSEMDEYSFHYSFNCDKTNNELYQELLSFRREDEYKNDNFISDGLSSAKIIKKAVEFLDIAKKETVKSSIPTLSVSATLKNLLVIDKFKPILNNFQIGNYIHIRLGDGDEEPNKVRLLSYEVSFGDLSTIQCEFSDVVKANGYVRDIKKLLSKTQSMASSFSYVARQSDNLTNETNNYDYSTLNIKLNELSKRLDELSSRLET